MPEANIIFPEVISEKDKPLLHHNGYDYQFQRPTADGSESWKCVKHQPKNCRGTIRVHPNWEINAEGVRFRRGRINCNDHYHAPSPNKSIYRKAAADMKRQANAPNPSSTRETVDAVRQRIPRQIHTSAGCPDRDAMARAYYRYKLKADSALGDRGIDSPDPLNIVIPPHMAESLILDQIFDHRGQQKRVLAFCTEEAKAVLERYGQHMCVDGTFSVGIYENVPYL